MTSIVPNKMEKPSASGESTMRCMLSSVWYPSTILPSLFVICDSGGRSEVSQVTVAVSPAVHTVSAFGDVIGGATTSRPASWTAASGAMSMGAACTLTTSAESTEQIVVMAYMARDVVNLNSDVD